MGPLARDLASRTVVTDVRVPGLRGCCLGWHGAHDDAHRACIKIGGESRQVRRPVMEAAGEPLASGDHVVSLCQNPWCINRAHLVYGPARDCHALGRHVWIGVGDLWVAKRLLAERETTADVLSQVWGVSPRLLENALQRVE